MRDVELQPTSPRSSAVLRRSSSGGSEAAAVDREEEERAGLLSQQPTPPAESAISSRVYAATPYATIILLSLTTMFVFADQNLMAPNLSAIAREFGMSDEERDQKLGGNIAVAFFLLGAPVSLLVGYLTDTFNRRNLFVAVVLLGEGPCLATAYIRTYGQLFAARALTGVSVGGCVPLLYSLLGDLVPPSRRSAVSAGVGIAQGAGIAVGQILAGYLGARHGWRLPFVVVALPALTLALLVLLCVEEPRRGAQEPALTAAGAGDGGLGGEYQERIEWRKVRGIFTIRTNLLAFAQGVPGCIPWGVMNTFFADYMATDMGMGVASATSMVAVFGVGSVVGNVAGGLGGQALYNAKPGALGVLMGVTTALGAIPLLLLINSAPGGATSVLAFLAGGLSCVTGTNVRAVLLGVNAPETRGTCFAVFSLTDSLGKGLGPAAVAALIARRGRLRAFNTAISLWFLCAVLLLGIAGTLQADEQALQGRLAAARAQRGAPAEEEQCVERERAEGTE